MKTPRQPFEKAHLRQNVKGPVFALIMLDYAIFGLRDDATLWI